MGEKQRLKQFVAGIRPFVDIAKDGVCPLLETLRLDGMLGRMAVRRYIPFVCSTMEKIV